MHRKLVRRAAVALAALTVVLLPIAGSERGAVADDPPATRFRFETAISWVREGPAAQACVRVVREGDTSTQQTVNVHSYSASLFYGFSGTTLTFPPGVTERTIDWPGASCLLLPDNASDDQFRTATLELSVPHGSSARVGSPSRHDITIVDDDGPPRVSFAYGYRQSDANFHVREHTGLVQLPLLRGGSLAESMTVECLSSDHSDATRRAALGSDYELPGWTETRRFTASFGAGEWETSCPVRVLDDAESEALEVVHFWFGTSSLPPGTGYGWTGITLGIVDDDNPGALRFETASVTVSESNGTVDIAVLRTGGANGPASVTCRLSATVPYTAAAGSDFSFTPQTLTWSDGDDLQKRCRITITDDALVEDDETVILELADLSGALLGSPPTVVVRIQSNDYPGQFRAGNVEVLESAGTFQVTVWRDSGTAGDAAVTCRLRTGAGAGTASEPADFTFAEQRLTWNAGEGGSKTCTGSLVNDTAAESSETVIIDLVDPAGATIAAPASVVVTILDDDGPGTLRFELGGLDYYWPPSGPPERGRQVAESAGTVRLRVERVNGSSGAVSVTCQLAAPPGSAAPGTDYTFAPQVLSWEDGETASKECEVVILDDSLIEQMETVRLQLANPTGGAVLGDFPAVVAVVILSDDGPGHLLFDSVTGNREGDPAGHVLVRRSGGSSGEVSVVCRLAGTSFTATPGVDFTFAQQTLTWGDGETDSKRCNFSVVDDALIEEDETVRLELVNPTGGAAVSGGAFEFWIRDNDAPVVTGVSPASGPIAGGTPITITGYNFTGATGVSLDGSVSCQGITVVSDTTITCTTPPRPGGAAAPYGPVSVVVSVPVGQSGARQSNWEGTADDFLYYGPGPSITQLVPAATTCNGQHWVLVRGTRFFPWPWSDLSTLQVRVGGQLANYQSIAAGFGDGALLVLVPTLSAGTHRVTVTTVEGVSADVPADDLACAAASGSPAPPASSTPAPITAAPAVSGVVPSSGVCDGTLQVAVLGSAFTAGATVTFGGAAAAVTYVNQNTLVIRPAARAPGQVDIRVTTPNGTSPNTPADDFTCLAPPAPGGSNPGPGGTGSPPGGANPGPGGTGGSNPGTPGAPDPATVTPGPVTYTLYATYTLIAWAGPDNASIAALLAANPTLRARISAIWTFDPVGQRWLGYFPGSESIPGANDFTTLRTGRSYFIAIRPGPSPISWLVTP